MKYRRTIFLFDSEANHTYKHIGGEEIRTSKDNRKFLHNNTVHNIVALWHTESTNDCSLIINNIFDNHSPYRAVTLKVVMI